MINFTAFVASLPIILYGMLGIFIVTGIIIATIYLIPYIEKLLPKKNKHK